MGLATAGFKTVTDLTHAIPLFMPGEGLCLLWINSWVPLWSPPSQDLIGPRMSAAFVNGNWRGETRVWGVPFCNTQVFATYQFLRWRPTVSCLLPRCGCLPKGPFWCPWIMSSEPLELLCLLWWPLISRACWEVKYISSEMCLSIKYTLISNT